jgi:GntP family gluconate:H+ symporter
MSLVPLLATTSPTFLFIALAATIAFVVVATTRFKVHPFLALIVGAYGMGLAGGLTPAQLMAALTGGFGRTLSQIGIVIACGCMIGTVLERSGCALVMANVMVRLIGKARAVLAMSCTGAVVSIPVFCDSGYVILSPLGRSLARTTGASLASFAVALSMGLYVTHCLVPPTPGPIAAAGELGADLGMVILMGIAVAVPTLAATYAYARYVGRRVHLMGEGTTEPAGESVDSRSQHAPPGALASFAPILLPVVLIALKSIADLPGRPMGDGGLRMVLGFVGDPVTALLAGVGLAWIIVRRFGRECFGKWCGDGLKDAGTIILITAAGGALGGVLRETPLATHVGRLVSSADLGSFSLLLPFLVAAGLKTAIGSSTVAIVTTASLLAPVLGTMGLATGQGPALATLAIASGAMMVSHVNDSYFWVITQMSGMTVAQGYRLITVASAIAGLTAISGVLALSVIAL